MHFVYIVRCADGSLYTGYARDPRARVRAHNAGRGARYTAGRRPVRLVYSERFETLSEALKREYELKQWPRARKQALIRSSRRSASIGDGRGGHHPSTVGQRRPGVA
jgi:putative endonuclease